jgi:ABC-type glycerol-3-phosphate transport system substrate-binding protein
MTRRELLAMIGVAAAAGCRGASPATDKPQQTESVTVTLTISGMI